MASHSRTLAWKIPWMEEPPRLQSMGSAKSWTRLSDFTFTTLNNLTQSTIILTQTSAILPISILAPLECVHKSSNSFGVGWILLTCLKPRTFLSLRVSYSF